MAGTRYLRYIVFAFVCLIVIFFISSSSTGPTEQYQQASDFLKDKWRGSNLPTDSKEMMDQINKIPSSDTPPAGKDFIKPETTPKTTPDTTPNHGTPLKGAPAPGERMNATFVTLARNNDVWEIAKSIRAVEDRFNHKYNYDWVFLNDKPFDEKFKSVTTALVSGKTKYGVIPEEHWSFPEWIDQDKAAEVRKDMAERKIIYGDSVSYRHMCRFESGFFFRQPLMLDYDWYWRVEPSIELYCDVDYDPFKYMADNNKKYSFVLSLFEYKETIMTLWDSTKTFMQKHPEHLAPGNSMKWLSDDNGESYTMCHFWSNFEIGNLNWLRSKAYIDYFEQLDHDGGFFYERWGDAPVHSIAAGLLLPKEEIHFFEDFGYWHVPFTHCPANEQTRIKNKCHCNPDENFDFNGYSCTKKFYELHNMALPASAGGNGGSL